MLLWSPPEPYSSASRETIEKKERYFEEREETHLLERKNERCSLEGGLHMLTTCLFKLNPRMTSVLSHLLFPISIYYFLYRDGTGLSIHRNKESNTGPFEPSFL